MFSFKYKGHEEPSFYGMNGFLQYKIPVPMGRRIPCSTQIHPFVAEGTLASAGNHALRAVTGFPGRPYFLQAVSSERHFQRIPTPASTIRARFSGSIPVLSLVIAEVIN